MVRYLDLHTLYESSACLLAYGCQGTLEWLCPRCCTALTTEPYCIVTKGVTSKKSPSSLRGVDAVGNFRRMRRRLQGSPSQDSLSGWGYHTFGINGLEPGKLHHQGSHDGQTGIADRFSSSSYVGVERIDLDGSVFHHDWRGRGGSSTEANEASFEICRVSTLDVSMCGAAEANIWDVSYRSSYPGVTELLRPTSRSSFRHDHRHFRDDSNDAPDSGHDFTIDPWRRHTRLHSKDGTTRHTNSSSMPGFTEQHSSEASHSHQGGFDVTGGFHFSSYRHRWALPSLLGSVGEDATDQGSAKDRDNSVERDKEDGADEETQHPVRARKRRRRKWVGERDANNIPHGIGTMSYPR